VSIARQLSSKYLLISGSTGFLGKALVEKILWSVPDIGHLYLLIRAKGGNSDAEQRAWDEIFSSSAFNRLRARHGLQFRDWIRDRVTALSGDLTQPDLGIDEESRGKMKSRLTGIINSAATVSFDERLDLALDLNTLGAPRLLNLARDCGNIPFLHVSTCYVSGRVPLDSDEVDVPESLYQAPMSRPTEETLDLEGTIEAIKDRCKEISQNGNGSSSRSLRDRLVQAGMEEARDRGWNDVYTFTKFLGEQVLSRDRGGVPLTILRPSIIEGAVQEPAPGWIDGLRMADPIIIAAGRGKLREFPGKPDVTLDLIPVDYVVNSILAALASPPPEGELQIYHVASSFRNPLRLGKTSQLLERAFRRRPLRDNSGRPIQATTVRLVDYDAYFVRLDRKYRLLSWLRRRLSFGKRLSRRLASSEQQLQQLRNLSKLYAPYTTHRCRYLDRNVQRLWSELSDLDRRDFPFDAGRIDWDDYIVDKHVPGLCRYMLGYETDVRKASSAPFDPPLGRNGAAPPRDDVSAAQSVYELFAGSVERWGDEPFCQIRRNGRWVRYTYAQANAAAANLSRRFQESGVGLGDRVVLWADNGPEWVLVCLAVYRAGAVLVPLDPQWTADQVCAAANFTEAKLVCAGPDHYQSLVGCSTRPRMVEMSPTFVPSPDAVLEGPPPEPLTRDQVASILFTSGTTVAPRAVMLTHGNFLTNSRGILEVQDVNHGDRLISVLPLYHSFEFTAGLLAPMAKGAAITYVEQLDGQMILSAMRETQATIMLVVPRLLQGLYSKMRDTVEQSGPIRQAIFNAAWAVSGVTGGRFGRMLFRPVHRKFGGRLRLLVSGGSGLDPHLFEAYKRLGFLVLEGYGMTETSPVLTYNPADSPKPGYVGRAIPGVQVKIHSPNSQGVGEVVATGGNVMKGYYKDPQATASIIRNGWVHTGDLGQFNRDGYLKICGRIKDLIVTPAGKNVYPDEVEHCYKDLPLVEEFCVVGIPEENGMGEQVHAVVVPKARNGASAKEDEMIGRLIRAADMVGDGLPSYQKISRFHIWDGELPKTSTLKVKRSEVRNTILERRNGHNGQSAGSSSNGDRLVETNGHAWLYEMLAELTGRPLGTITPDSSLTFDLGVDSLMKVELICDVESRLGVSIPNELISNAPRVRDIVAYIGDRQPVTESGKNGRWGGRIAPTNRALADAKDPSILQKPLQWTARGLVNLFFASYTRLVVKGRSHVPAKGAFILAANHSSHLDSVAVRAALNGRRMPRIAGARDYFFTTTVRGWFFSNVLGVIPFDRDNETLAGLQRCMAVLEQGETLLVFPEGTRSLDGEIHQFKVGLGVLAAEANVPIIPVRVEGTHELLPKGKFLPSSGTVTVHFGAPIRPSESSLNGGYHGYRDLVKEVQHVVESLG
jgi:long-chain acyl-CoA synthetase